jgi:hypothetical protein
MVLVSLSVSISPSVSNASLRRPLTSVFVETGVVELPHVEVQADDGEHEDGKEEEHADLEQRNHGLHDGLQDNLKT